MKHFVTLFSFIFFLGIFSVYSQCCNKTARVGNDSEAISLSQESNELSVEAYYFHFSRRCVTCRNVERVSSEFLQDLYGDKIQLKSVNLDDAAGEKLAKKLGVEGQSLLFVNGSKKVDITMDGFMYAMRNPEKLKEKIKSTVESLK